MLGVARDVQRTVTLQLYLSFAVDAGFLPTVRSVGKCVLCPFLGADLDTLAVGDVDGCT